MQTTAGFFSKSAIIIFGLALHVDAMAADPINGGQIYQTHCSNCHGPNGASPIPGVPDFSRQEGLFQPDSGLASAVRTGKGVMPAFQGILKENEIFDVVAYLRTLR